MEGRGESRVWSDQGRARTAWVAHRGLRRGDRGACPRVRRHARDVERRTHDSRTRASSRRLGRIAPARFTDAEDEKAERREARCHQRRPLEEERDLPSPPSHFVREHLDLAALRIDSIDRGLSDSAWRGYFGGTNARKRRGLSTRILRSVASFTPAWRSLGTNCRTTDENPFPQLAFRLCVWAKSPESIR